MHINKYRAADEVPAALQLAIDYTVCVGSYIAVLDDENDQHYHMAQVIDMTDQITTIHYMGTKSRRLRDAKWIKLFHHPGTGDVVTEQPQNLIRHWTRFTGVIDTKPIEDSLIILPNVGFTNSMRVNANSRNALGRFKLRHHRMGSTWNP